MALQLLVNGEDFTDAWRVYESRWSMRAWQGESVQSEFLIDDPGGSFVHADFAARKIVEVWEDASGSPKCMYRGRIANKSLGPGNFHAPGHAMRWTLQTEDFNIDLRGIRVINADRPEESNYDRAEVIRLAYLNGAASTHPQARDSTDLDGGMYLGPTPGDAVTLDPAVYEDTDPVGVLTQMTEQDGHLFFVYLQNDGVGALAYMKITDEAILSNITVVDDGHDEGADGEDIFAAYWADMAGDHGGQNVLTGAGIRYGDGSYAEESDVSGYEAIYDKWETTFTNDLIYYAVTAEAYVNTTVAANDEVHTYFASIDVKPSHVHRIKAGMMVPLIRKRANKLGNATARAVVVTYEPYKRRSDGEALYRVILELGRPRFLRTIPPKRRKMPRPPTQPVPGTCTRLYFSTAGAGIDPAAAGLWDTDSAGGTYEDNQLKTTADGTYGAANQSAASAGGSSTDVRLSEHMFVMTSGLAAIIAAGGATVQMQALARSRYGTGISEAAQDNISQLVVRVFDSGGSYKGTPYDGHALGSSAGSAKWPAQATKVNRVFPPAATGNALAAVATAVAGDYLVVEAGYRSFTVGTTGAAMSLMSNGASDLPSNETATDTGLNAWIEICSGTTAGDTPSDVGDSGSGSPGTSTKYAPIDHTHAHGTLSPDDLHHHGDNQIEGIEDYVEVRRTDSDSPTATDDEDDGWRPGDLWVDRTANEVYVNTTATAGAAVWEQFVPGGGSLADHDHTTAGGDGGDLDAALIGNYVEFTEASAPSTPSSGFARVYVKSDGRVYSKGDDGVERGPFDAASSGGGSFGFPGPLGFPWVDTVATTQITTNATSHSVNLPTGIVSGDLLLMILACDGSPTTCTATGWTSVTAGGSAGNCSITVLYRIADGSEGATITVATSASEQLTAWVGRLQAHHASAAPEGANVGVGTAESLQTSPSLTPSWGADDTLWFCAVSCDGSAASNIDIDGQPLNYVFVYNLPNANTTTVGLRIAYRWLNAASEDPGFWHNAANSEQYAGATIAVRPV